MRKSGRIISLVMSALIMFSAGSMLTTSASAAERTTAVTGASKKYSGTVEECKWSFDEKSGKLTITGKGTTNSSLCVNTDEDYDERDYVPWYDFNKKIKSVVIGNGVTDIGTILFSECENLTSVSIPESVTVIHWGAFSYCSALKSIKIPSSVKRIEESAFYYCNALTSVKISDLEAWCNIKFESDSANPLSIAKNLYLNDKLVTEIDLTGRETSIGDYAFNNAVNISKITLGDKIKGIGVEAFNNTAYYNNKSNWNNNILFIDKYLIRAEKDLSGEFEVADGTLGIAGGAFFECDKMTGVSIPASLTFSGVNAFDTCDSLSRVDIKDLEAWCKIDFLYGEYCGSYSNPTTQAENLYLNGELLTDLVIPDGITQVKANTFFNCSKIKTVFVPSSVKKIGDNAFFCCTSVENFTLSEGLEEIGVDAFRCCDTIRMITIPKTVKKMKSAFEYCENLSVINITDIAAWCNIEFASIYCNPLANEYQLYLNNEPATDIVIPNGVEVVKNYVFAYWSDLESVVIPNSVKSIGDYAFYGCNLLKSLKIGSSVTTIGESAFESANCLKSVVIPDSVTRIKTHGFAWCLDLTDVKLPKNVKLGKGVFRDTKFNPAKITVTKKTVKAKTLRSKKVTVKPLKIKNAPSSFSVKMVKKGTSAKIYKKFSVNKKTGAITINKGKYSKKTYKIKLKITVNGGKYYGKITIDKTVKVRVK